jgi:hypothetical protein
MRASQRQNGKESEKLFKGIGLTEMVYLKRRWKGPWREDFKLKKLGESQ